MLTTYGVGELSAINAPAGSYAESIPVVSLVGTPSRRTWEARSAKQPVHHTLADGRMEVYSKMAKEITCAQANFHEFATPVEALEAYDEALIQCMRWSKPAYITVPCDMFELEIPSRPLEESLSIPPTKNGFRLVDSIMQVIPGKLRASRQPLLIVDGLAYPFNMISEARELSRYMHTACFTSGKGIIDESRTPGWLGTLSGPTAYSSSADLALMIGPLLADTNTAAWSAIPRAPSIKFNADTVVLDGHQHSVSGKFVLQHLVDTLLGEGRAAPTLNATSRGSTTSSSLHKHRPISQDVFWSTMSSFIERNDTVLLANGTLLVGGRDLQLPTDVQVVASGIWCSIGQMPPAAQGIALGKRDAHIPGRTILFEGDGSFQTTCQALSDIIRYRLNITIFLVNNAGYTYERWLNGIDAEYNDVPPWRYVYAPDFFGAHSQTAGYLVTTVRVKTMLELENMLRDRRLRGGQGLKIVDVVMDPQDIPKRAEAGLLRGREALRPIT